MLRKDEGVVLKVARSGESSLLVTFLGRELGKVRLVAKGVLSPKHPSRGLLESGNHIEVVYYYKENRSVYYLREVSLLSSPASGRDSLPHMAAFLSAMELLDQVCYPGSADAAIVDLAAEYLRTDAGSDPLFVFLAFEVKLLGALGAIPDLSGCADCGGDIARGVFDARNGVAYCREHAGLAGDSLLLPADLLDAIDLCAAGTLAGVAAVELEKRTRKQLGKLVHWTYTFHVQGYSLPRSLSLI